VCNRLQKRFTKTFGLLVYLVFGLFIVKKKFLTFSLTFILFQISAYFKSINEVLKI